MKKLDFTPKNVINCVDNEPALWDTQFTDVHPEIIYCTYQLISLAFISGSIVLYASVSVSDILFNSCGVLPFLRLGRYHCGT